MKPEDKEKVLNEVIQRVWMRKIENSLKNPLENIINDTIYHEKRRLDIDKKTKYNLKWKEYWKKVNKRLINATEEEKKELLKDIITRFANEIVGNFNPKVYKFTTKILPFGLSILLNAFSPKLYLKNFPKLPDISEKVIVQGEYKKLQALEKLGTIILVPTHSSNMDSIVVGWSIYKLGLPPFTYGAGLNLFTNKIISYFMHNLGAYKVDRKKTASLYKEVLKEYATCTLEHGYHNLFFPGGTRSRSGAIENKLKLGLLGTGIKAYINNLKNNKPKPNIFVVPCTISYELVLEAENLIEDFLKITGKSRYIIEDDEFSQPRRILNFMTGILRLNSRIYVTICEPLDLFGNKVDERGISYDKRGREIDIRRYLLKNGKIEHDELRDKEYTRELGEEVKASYYKNNVIMSTHLLAFVVHQLLEKHNPELDIYRLLRTKGGEENLPINEVYNAMELVLTRLKGLEEENKILLAPYLTKLDINKIMEEALEHFRIYHTKVVIYRKGDRIYPNDTNLIFYYHNRLTNYGLERLIKGNS